MNRWTALHALRIGCVKYLNAKPLIHAYDGEVVFDHPSALARGISRGDLDAGLVPIFEALGARDYLAVDGVAIACDGPVFSVFLAYRGALADVRTIALDPASLTSVNLLKVLLSEFHGMRPEFVDVGVPADAELLIGNQAIEFRREHAATHRFLDLGEEWKRCTGLPFVFALWLLRPGLAGVVEIAEAFRALQRDGLARLPEIVVSATEFDAAFRQRYLTEHIRFGLGAREKEAVEKFRALLPAHGLVAVHGSELSYV